MSEPDDLAAHLVEEIEIAIDDHASLIKHVLAALASAGITLDCRTAGAMHELAEHIVAIRHSTIEDEV